MVVRFFIWAQKIIISNNNANTDNNNSNSSTDDDNNNNNKRVFDCADVKRRGVCGGRNTNDCL